MARASNLRVMQTSIEAALEPKRLAQILDFGVPVFIPDWLNRA